MQFAPLKNFALLEIWSENNGITIEICMTIDFNPLKKFLEESQTLGVQKAPKLRSRPLLAESLHPRKNGGDLESNSTFQSIFKKFCNVNPKHCSVPPRFKNILQTLFCSHTQHIIRNNPLSFQLTSSLCAEL